MNFLAGPMTRAQIPALNQLVDAQTTLRATPVTGSVSRKVSTPQPSVEAFQPVSVTSISQPPNLQPVTSQPANVQPSTRNVQPSTNGNLTKPTLPAGIREYFLPQNYSLPEAFQSAKRAMPSQAMIQGIVYRPSLLAAAQVRLLDRKYGVDSEITKTALVDSLDRRGIIRWDEFSYAGPSLDKVETMSVSGARFGTIDAPLNDSKLMTSLQKDFTDWIFRNAEVTARANLKLKVFGGPDISQAEFMKACSEAAREGRDAELEKKTAALDKKIKSTEDKLFKEERELQQDEADLRNRNIETGLSGAEAVAGLFGLGRKKSLTTSVSKYRMAQNAKEDVKESEDAIAQYKKELASLERQREEIATEINNSWGSVVNEISEVSIKPKKTDIYVNLFGVAWKPFYIVQAGDETIELPAFGAE
jgi:hypothetical protein